MKTIKKQKGVFKMNVFKKILFVSVLFYFPSFISAQELITANINTGGNQVASIGELVVLDSKDTEVTNRESLNYIWSIVSKPDSSKADLFSINEFKTSFVPDVKGNYTIRLYIYSGGFIDYEDTIVLVKSPQVRATARAGVDELVRPGSLVDLSAEASFHFGSDKDLKYEWVLDKIPEGSSAQIFLPDSKETSFVADKPGVYLVRLIVRAENSQISEPSYKVVRVEGADINAPIANAGSDKIVLVGEDLSLTGTVNYIGTETLSYEWEIVSFPEGSSAELQNANSLRPVFNSDTSGDYLLSLNVMAGELKGVPDFIKVIVSKKPVPLVVDTNLIALTNQKVQLDASPSFDPEGLNLTYNWTVVQKPSGSLVEFSDTSNSKTSFSGNKEGDYTLSLVLSNAYFSSSKSVKIRLLSSANFKAEAGANQVITAGSSLSLSASSSLGNDLSYFWSLVEKPSLSLTEVLESNFENAKASIDKVGAYIFRLRIKKEGVLSDPDYVVFNAVLPKGKNLFNELFRNIPNPRFPTLKPPLSISECAEIKRTFIVSDPDDKEYFILFENKGVEEFFVMLNGKALTGKLENGTDTFVYSVSLLEENNLSIRVRGSKTDSLRVRIIEKSSSQSFPTPPSLSSQSLTVSLGGSASVSVSSQSGLTYSILEGSAYGTAVVNSSGELTYTSNGVPVERDFIAVKAVDANGLVSVATIKVTIN